MPLQWSQGLGSGLWLWPPVSSGPCSKPLCSPEWGSAGQRVGARVLGAWGSAPGWQEPEAWGLESVGDGGCASFPACTMRF